MKIPVLTTPWRSATRIVGDHAPLSREEMKRWGRGEPIVDRFFNDFCLARDSHARWHLIGHVDHGHTGFVHFIGDALDRPFREVDPVLMAESGSAHDATWSPFVIWRDETVALLFYAHLSEGSGHWSHSIRCLESLDDLTTWSPAGTIAMAEEPAARDPCIIRDGGHDRYLMYYVSSADGHSVRVRESADLLSWSDATTVLGPPPKYGAAESVFVVIRERLYYLWVCGLDYAVMSLYISENPFSFGDPSDNRIVEQPGHAPEIVVSDGRHWMACSAIATESGFPPGSLGSLPSSYHDLPGIYIQPLQWVDATREQAARVVRT